MAQYLDFIMKENINDIQPMLDLMLEGWWGRIQERSFLDAFSPCSVLQIQLQDSHYNSDEVCEWGPQGHWLQKLHYVKVIWSHLCNHFCTTSKYYTPETDIINQPKYDFGKTRQRRQLSKNFFKSWSLTIPTETLGAGIDHKEKVSLDTDQSIRNMFIFHTTIEH